MPHRLKVAVISSEDISQRLVDTGVDINEADIDTEAERLAGREDLFKNCSPEQKVFGISSLIVFWIFQVYRDQIEASSGLLAENTRILRGEPLFQAIMAAVQRKLEV